ncbi:nitrilase-related carbon-nitrogen hydrolase [Psychrobacter aestuarii]|uniref:Carbon-nitrogen hydrolase family protein n=1 Tax=Psychrobacter aestuarii TaxID=556327 RepID=A0ABN0VK17_9GAMM|nr:nitrilase-related carbon-nitrogen hydrolase [Psychrobacter aestuarii]
MQHFTHEPLSIAAVQLNSQQDRRANLEVITQAVADASAQGAQLVVLPENCCSMGAQSATAAQFDALSSTLAQLAAKHQVHLLAGTLPCPYRPDGTPVPDDRLRQVSQLFAPDGTQVARYDKIHLFQATVADDTGSYNEAATFEAGTQTVVAPIRLDAGTYHVGMMVCFDLRFPALAQRLRQAGSDLLSAPSAFTYLTGQAHWSLLLRARALDSQCMVIGAAQGGTHQYPSQAARQTWGHSAITRHDGTVAADYAHSALTEVNAKQGYALIMASCDKGAQASGRETLPIFNCHRLA